MHAADKILKLYYYRDLLSPHGGNAGDLLSRFVVERISGCSVRYAGPKEKRKLIALGSLMSLKTLFSGSTLWGTGILNVASMRADGAYAKLKHLWRRHALGASNIRALRGPISAQAARSIGFDSPDVYGDPAILLPRLYFPVISAADQVGLVLHHTHEEKISTVERERIQDSGIKLISVLRKEEHATDLIDEICSCERIYSSSLHGLIIAQAYGIPATWLVITSIPIRKDDPLLKFHDYFLGSGQTVQEPLIVDTFYDIPNSLTRHEHITEVKRFDNIDRLIDAFPYDLLLKRC